jgi:hypothetical protein
MPNTQTKHLTDQEIIETFINAKLKEDYNFLQEDLVNLANAIVAAAEPKIRKAELMKCVEVARSVNTLVADKILEVRSRP